MERKLYPKKRFTYKFHNCNIWWWGKAFGCHLKPLGQRFWAHGRRLMLKSIPLVGAFRPRRLEWSPPPPPQKTVLMSFDCSFSLGASLPFHHALTIIISAFLDLSDGRDGSRCHRFKFFGFCDGILSFLGRVCVAVMAPTIDALSFWDGASKFMFMSIDK